MQTAKTAVSSPNGGNSHEVLWSVEAFLGHSLPFQGRFVYFFFFSELFSCVPDSFSFFLNYCIGEFNEQCFRFLSIPGNVY